MSPLPALSNMLKAHRRLGCVHRGNDICSVRRPRDGLNTVTIGKGLVTARLENVCERDDFSCQHQHLWPRTDTQSVGCELCKSRPTTSHFQVHDAAISRDDNLFGGPRVRYDDMVGRHLQLSASRPSVLPHSHLALRALPSRLKQEAMTPTLIERSHTNRDRYRKQEKARILQKKNSRPPF